MIKDNRLLLPFPFYDDINDQSWRTTGNYNTWYHQSGLKEIPPFQIKTDNQDTSFTSVSDWLLYDMDDNMVADLGANYDIENALEIKTDGSYYWFIHDSSLLLNNDLPTGFHYIRATIGGKHYYSEVFNTCDKCNPEENLVYNTDGLADIYAYNSRRSGPQLYHYKSTYNRTYITWQLTTSGKIAIAYYDHDKHYMSDYTTITTGGTDPHQYTAVIISGGYVIVVRGTAHNGPFYVYRSDSVEDISSFTQKGTLGNTTTNRLCYPHIWKYGNNVYITGRASNATGNTYDRVRLYKSTDNGATWDTGTDIVNVQTGTVSPENSYKWWAYHWMQEQHADDGIIFTTETTYTNTSVTTTYGAPDVYWLQSYDGDSWYNISDFQNRTGPTWQISVDGVINRDDLDTNFLVKEADISTDPNQINIAVAGSIADGKVYLILADYVRGTPFVFNNFWFAYYTTSWQFVNMGFADNNPNRIGGLISYSENVHEFSMVYDDNGTDKIRVYRTADKGVTWTMVKEYYPPYSNYITLRQTLNSPDAEYVVRSVSQDDNWDLWFGVENPNCERIYIEYWNSTDFDDVIYQTGYKNKIHLDGRYDLVRSEYEPVKTGIERDGYFYTQKITTKKKYKVVFYAPEYMADVMLYMELHDTIYVTDKYGNRNEADEVNVSIEPGTAFYKITLEFVFDPVTVTSSETNKSLT